jgi:hypothetical protein
MRFAAKSIGRADCNRSGNKLPQEPITMQVDPLDGGPFAIWVLLFAVALISPLPFQTGEEENAVATSGILRAMQQEIQSELRRDKALQQGHLQTGDGSEGGHARAPYQD